MRACVFLWSTARSDNANSERHLQCDLPTWPRALTRGTQWQASRHRARARPSADWGTPHACRCTHIGDLGADHANADRGTSGCACYGRRRHAEGHTAASALLTAVRALPVLRVAWLRVRGRWHASYAHHVPVPRHALGAVRRLLRASSPMLHTACHVAWCTSSHIAQCMRHGLCVAC